MKPIYERIFQEAKPFLRTRKNLIHTKIVLKYALNLLEEEEGDEEVVIPAVLLHDVGWKRIPETLQLTAFGPNRSNPELERVHEVEGARIAKGILETLHYPSGKVKEICQIIRGHDTRKRSLSQNDRIVKDADKLFRYSRRGVAIDTDRFNISRESRLQYLKEQIGKWLFLPASRHLAGEELARRRKEKEVTLI
jgi:HD superfamily phosphodiesterase